MRDLIIGLLFLAGTTSAQAEGLDLDRLFGNPSPAIEMASECIFDHEYETGPDKFCVYDCSGRKTTKTMSPDELCPVYINV